MNGAGQGGQSRGGPRSNRPRVATIPLVTVRVRRQGVFSRGRPYSSQPMTAASGRGIPKIDAYEGSQRQTAVRFRVSLSFVARLLRRRRQTGSLDPKPYGGGGTSRYKPNGP